MLTEDLQRAKAEFARALDARMANSNSRLDFESNPFVVADKPITEQIKSREKNYKNSRDFVLQASEKKFTQALTILQDLEKAKKKKEEEEKEKLAKKPEISNLDGRDKSSSASKAKSALAKKQSKSPIIIVPSAITSCLTLENSVEFFTAGTLPEVTGKRQILTGKPKAKTFNRVIQGTTINCHVLDNPTKLSPADWDRVVATFLIGATWQFTGWHWKEPVDIFSHSLSLFAFAFLLIVNNFEFLCKK